MRYYNIYSKTKDKIKNKLSKLKMSYENTYGLNFFLVHKKIIIQKSHIITESIML